MAQGKKQKVKARKTRPRIYVSAPLGAHMNERRKRLRQGILDVIDQAGFAAQEFGVSGLPAAHDENWTFEAARSLMTRCDGAIILGLARSFDTHIDWSRYHGQLAPLTDNERHALFDMVVRGSDEIAARVAGVTGKAFAGWMKAGTPFRDALQFIERDVADQAKKYGSPIRPFPTEYNHFEGALAIAEGLPTLILAEQGMERRGILYEGAGHTIVEIPEDATGSWLSDQRFEKSFIPFSARVKERSDVFLGYCSKDSKAARTIRKHLEGSGYEVHDWARDFKKAGATILEEIHRAAERCRTAVFVFAKNDPLKGKASAKAVPRDNVLLEAGYFIQARGKERVAIIREEGAKMPADLGGVIYMSFKDGSSKGQGGLKRVLTDLEKFLEGAI